MSHDFSYDYLSARPVQKAAAAQILHSNAAKVENYKKIKLEEAAARAQLMNSPGVRSNLSSAQKPRGAHMNGDLNSLAAHRRIPSHLDQKYKPSENALAAYSPLRQANGASQFVS